MNPANPHAWLTAGGVLAGALSGGIEAALSDGDFGDVMLGVGLGAAFGLMCPTGAIGGLVGGSAFAVGAWMAGKDRQAIATAYQWGNLVGGLAGDFTGGMVTGARTTLTRMLLRGAWHAGPDLVGAGVGAAIGYGIGRDLNSAYHGANIGMMVGGIGGGIYRWGRGTRLGGSTQVTTAEFHRKKANVGVFSALRVPMQMRYVRQAAREGGIGLKGVKVVISRDASFLTRIYFGVTRGKSSFILYPRAFTNTEQLVKTIAHERTHLMQRKIFGIASESSEFIPTAEKAAEDIEEVFWKYYLEVGRTGTLERFR